MKTTYRGFEIDCRREDSLGGDNLLYFSIMRLSDNCEMLCDFSSGSETVKKMTEYLKESVDDMIENPQDWESDL